MELKLNLKKDALKAVRLLVDGTKTELKQNGYGGGSNTHVYLRVQRHDSRKWQTGRGSV